LRVRKTVANWNFDVNGVTALRDPEGGIAPVCDAAEGEEKENGANSTEALL